MTVSTTINAIDDQDDVQYNDEDYNDEQHPKIALRFGIYAFFRCLRMLEVKNEGVYIQFVWSNLDT